MQPDLLTPRPVFMAQLHAERFTAHFLTWLPENEHVYVEFERQALAIAQRRSHYSARTIVEVLRHNSALREVGGQFKLSDWHTPYLARLFALLNPQHKALFEFREAKAAKADHQGVTA